MPNYTPEKGDFIVATFDPQSRHEQKGRKPALVILVNKATGFTIVCLITNTNRNIPFHIKVSEKILLIGFLQITTVRVILRITSR